MSKEFFLGGGDADFNSRQKSVFDQLGTPSQSSGSSASTVTLDDFKSHRDSTSRRSQHKRSNETRRLRGQESLFKRPEPPPPKRLGQNRLNRMPDHRTNPQRWTHYTLGDVSSDDMSDRTNTSTALSFLNELRKRKDQDDEEADMDVDQKAKSVQFKKPTRKRADVEVFCPSAERSESQGPLFRGSKRVMPEYVVGQKSGQSGKKVRNKKDEKGSSEAKPGQMKLGHLMDEEEED